MHPFGVSEQLIAHIMWQLLQALRYLQDRHILHRYEMMSILKSMFVYVLF